MTISEVMRQKARGERNAVGDVWGDHNCATAADTIDALVAALEHVVRVKEWNHDEDSSARRDYDLAADKARDALALARGGK